MDSNQTPAIIRTWVPIAVGAIISWLATKGIEVDANTSAALFISITAAIQAVYYLVVKVIEVKFPQFGWLLGLAKAPAYSPQDPPQPAPVVADEIPEAENIHGLQGRYHPGGRIG